MEEIISRRIGRNVIGFGHESTEETVRRTDGMSRDEIMANSTPKDLIEFGMIPEFVGRLPVLVTLDQLQRDDLVRILTEPRNALVKQFQRIFEFENVSLTFTEEALEEIAEMAMERKIGARGLRVILEDLMLDMMYQLPSQSDVSECVITREVVRNEVDPIVVMEKTG